MLYCILAGACLLYSSMIVFTLDVRKTTLPTSLEAQGVTFCVLRQILPGVAFTFFWGAILLKIRRTYIAAVQEVVDKKSSKGRKLQGNCGLMLRLLVLLVIECGLQAAYAHISPPALNSLPKDTPGFEGVPAAQYCYSPRWREFEGALLAYHGDGPGETKPNPSWILFLGGGGEG